MQNPFKKAVDTTHVLKQSIRFERSKTDLTNLVNHKEEDLHLPIDAFELSMREYQLEIDIRERMLNEGEDMSEMVIKNLNEAIQWRRDQIQSLIAWRAIFMSAIEKVKE